MLKKSWVADHRRFRPERKACFSAQAAGVDGS
jgi:hypothetical protein